MNCKQGDLAIVVGGKRNQGKIVRCLQIWTDPHRDSDGRVFRSPLLAHHPARRHPRQGWPLPDLRAGQGDRSEHRLLSDLRHRAVPFSQDELVSRCRPDRECSRQRRPSLPQGVDATARHGGGGPGSLLICHPLVIRKPPFEGAFSCPQPRGGCYKCLSHKGKPGLGMIRTMRPVFTAIAAAAVLALLLLMVFGPIH